MASQKETKNTAPRFYVRSEDKAKMVEIAPHQFVNEAVLKMLGKRG